MRLLVVVSLLAVLATLVAAWEEIDYYIFDLVSEVEKNEPKGSNFYSLLDISPTATTAEINKAFKKKSIRLHPDKNPGVKGAHDRYARLGNIAKLLKNDQQRERYDFFFKNGVPTWRGTGYYYSRWRPGIGSVFVFLAFVTSGMQHVAQRIKYRNDLARVEETKRNARQAAWGEKMVPLAGQRKVKVNLGGPRTIDDEGNVQSGRWINLVVDGPDRVYLVDEEGEKHLLDESTATRPAISRTWCIALLVMLYRKVVPPKEADAEAEVIEDVQPGAEDTDGTASDAPGSGTVTPNGVSSAAVRKVGGKRNAKKGAKKR